ncbi:MAG: DUF4105 domain-containing protein [Gemmatimonadales bacterium]
MRALFAALLAALPLAWPARSLEGQSAARPGEPGSELTVYLMTMGPGALVWERFGHNAIWIHDPANPPDQAYNYGLFDFRQQNFLLRFIRGQMWYWMEGFAAERHVGTYVRDNRSVWLQELELPPAARLELQRYLLWNERPENRYYHYDYYRDNCSTRVRDAIDRVIGGQIQTQTAELPSGTTYRFHTQRLTANDPAIFTGLLLAGGEGVDRPISAWEEMFLPLAMREHLRRVTILGPTGARMPLVKSERTLFTSTAPAPPDSPPQWLPWYLLLGLAIGGTALALGRSVRRNGAARLGFGIVVGSWALLAGLAGVILAGLWGFTDHQMAYRNENLFQVNPLALALVLLVPFGLARLRRVSPAARWLAGALAALSVIGLLVKLLPGFDQVNAPVIALALPANLGVAAALWRLR